MNHVEVEIQIGDVIFPATGPTLATAIGNELPNLAHTLGSPYSIFGVRPRVEDELAAGNHRVTVSQRTDLDDWKLNRCRVSQEAIPKDLELYDVNREMLRAEAALREAVGDRDSNYNWVYDLAKDYLDCVNKVLIYDPDACIKRRKKMKEIFRGLEWRFQYPRIHKPATVTIRKLAVVEGGEIELLLRFEYYFARPGGMSVHGRAIEFADRSEAGWRIRNNRLSALRGLFPPFSGKQLPQVHRDLQVAFDAGAFASARPECVQEESASAPFSRWTAVSNRASFSKLI